jgi:hypothetical protein
MYGINSRNFILTASSKAADFLTIVVIGGTLSNERMKKPHPT